MSRPPRRPAPLIGKIFRARTAVAGGLLTAADLRSSAWQPLFHGIYADSDLTISHRRRCLAVSAYLLPAGGAVAGRSAAHLYGAPDEPPDVEVVVPPTSRLRARGVRMHHAVLADTEIRLLRGIPVTAPARTCWDLANWLDPVEAVTCLDALVRRRIVTVAEMRAYARTRSGARGWRRVLRAADLVDPGAESPQESRLRVRLVVAGLPRPVTQYVIERDGRFVARADLAWPEYRVAVEYDGAWHVGSTEQMHADRRRLNDMVGSDWIVLHVTARRLREDFDGFVAELRAALAARRPS